MMKIKTSLLALAAVLASSASASAADFDAASSVSTWDGFYIGGHAGYAWGEVSNNTIPNTPNNPWLYDMDGLAVGLHGGFNIQADSIIIGIEGDVGPASIAGDYTTPVGNRAGSTSIDWTASIRGRLGFLIDDATLIYGTGGVAFAELSSSIPTAQYSVSEDFTGWTAGGGFERKVDDRVRARIEYLYSDYGSVEFTGTQGRSVVTSYDSHVIRAGLSLSFD